MLLAAGKASIPMMKAAVRILKGFPVYGIVVATKSDELVTFNSEIEVFRAGHPAPDRDGLKASQRVIGVLNKMREDELMLCLISGGASAMLPAPSGSISLREKKKVTELLVKSGASIHEINTVRRHLSKLKGGRLVELCPAREMLSFIISDVPGDCLPDIASGLTAEDPTSYRDAMEVLKTYDLWNEVPERVKCYLAKGIRGEVPDTPKPGNASFKNVRNIIIANNRTACRAAKKILRASRVPSMVLTSVAEIESSNIGKLLASIAQERKQCEESVPHSGALILGGETTVQVKGNGIGGRNQETVLSAVEQIANLDGTVVAALGTDGIDGNSPAAGAIADGNTAERANRRRLNPHDFLARNDSYRFFKRLNDSLVTGQTGTNVADLYLMLSLESNNWH
jgi:glycerate 2-kinase